MSETGIKLGSSKQANQQIWFLSRNIPLSTLITSDFGRPLLAVAQLIPSGKTWTTRNPWK